MILHAGQSLAYSGTDGKRLSYQKTFKRYSYLAVFLSFFIALAMETLLCGEEILKDSAATPVSVTTPADPVTGNFLYATNIYEVNGVGSCNLVINNKEIKEMRFGNTIGELKLTSWEPYKQNKTWHYKTGPNEIIVYAEFKTNTGRVDILSLILPSIQKIKIKEDVVLRNKSVRNTFNNSYDNWYSYHYRENLYYNVFYPATFEYKGGAEDNSGYIFTDDSRWSIDFPECPNSVLALLTYARWSNNDVYDLRNAEISLYLRGEISLI